MRVRTGVMLAVLLLVGGCKDTKTASSANGEKHPDEEIYIPRDLDDCFVQLKEVLKPEDIEEMRRGTEDDMIQYHFGLGMWMRNN